MENLEQTYFLMKYLNISLNEIKNMNSYLKDFIVKQIIKKLNK